MIKWNEVTWYSKALAMAIFVFLPFGSFYLGLQYGELKTMDSTKETVIYKIITKEATTPTEQSMGPMVITPEQTTSSWADTLRLAKECRVSYLGYNRCDHRFTIVLQSGERLTISDPPGLGLDTIEMAVQSSSLSCTMPVDLRQSVIDCAYSD